MKKTDTERTSLPVLIWHWLKDVRRRIETGVFRWVLRRHGVRAELNVLNPYTYWMNIVIPVGGGEKMKPCEYFFETPWAAALHEKVIESCQTWDFVATVIIDSPVKLTTTDYERMMECDEEYADLLRQMRAGEPDTLSRELESDTRRMSQMQREWESDMAEIAGRARQNWKRKHNNNGNEK